MSLQLPLDPEPGNTGKSWWRKLKDTLRPRSRHLAERSAVPVHRQNAAIKVGNSISEPEVTQYTKVVSEVEKRVVVRDDVIFVNNGGAQGNGIAAHGAVEDGTAERPFDTIQEGVDLSATAGYQAKGVPTVFVAGSDIIYPSVVLKTSIQLISGGAGIPAFMQHRFGLGDPAMLDQISNIPDLAVDESNPVTRFVLSGFRCNDVILENVTNALLSSNTLSHVEIKNIGGSYNIAVIGNHFISGTAVRISSWYGTTHLLVKGNTFTFGATEREWPFRILGSVRARIIGNTFEGDWRAELFYLESNSEVYVDEFFANTLNGRFLHYY